MGGLAEDIQELDDDNQAGHHEDGAESVPGGGGGDVSPGIWRISRHGTGLGSKVRTQTLDLLREVGDFYILIKTFNTYYREVGDFYILTKAFNTY